MKTYVGITAINRVPIRNQRSSQGQRRYLCSSGSVVFFSEKLWREALESLRIIQDKLADRKVPCERRFGTPFDGPDSRERDESLRELTLQTLKSRHESCDKFTPNNMSTSDLTAWFFSQSRSIELRWQPRSYSSSIRGMKTKSSKESWKSCSKFHGTWTLGKLEPQTDSCTFSN